MQTEKIFEGLHVVDLSSVLAGPSVATFFAELGATVLKIENKTTNGDVTRLWKLPSEPPNALSAYYCSVNYRKKVLFLDLNIAADQQKAQDFCWSADIVVSNFKPSNAAQWGLSYDDLKIQNPRLIFAQLYGFSADNDAPAFDVVLQALTGYLSMNGLPNQQKPTKMPVALIDVLAAHQLKQAILIALYQREKTGRGSFVSTSLFDSAIASLTNQATNWLMANQIPQKMGAEHPNIAPYGDTFLTKDKKTVVLACGTEKQFQQLCKVLKLENLWTESEFSTNVNRVVHRQKLNQLLKKAIQKFESQTLFQQLETQKIPHAPILNMKEVFEQPLAKRMILEEKNENQLTKRVKTVAFQVKNT